MLRDGSLYLVDILPDKLLQTMDPELIRENSIQNIGPNCPESAEDDKKELRGIGLYDQAAGELCSRFLPIRCTEYILLVFPNLTL